jgi:hypothetical protein
VAHTRDLAANQNGHIRRQAVRMMQRMNPRDGLAQIRDALDLYHVLKTPPVFWALLLSVQAGACPGVSRISGEHDRVPAADGPAVDHRGVNADVYSVVLSSSPEDSRGGHWSLRAHTWATPKGRAPAATCRP